MQPLFSVDSIKAIEAAYVKQQGVELYELMQRAGARAFEKARHLAADAQHWLIATGAGNNAGDGLVVAKHALSAGFDVTLVALNPYEEFVGDPKQAWQELQAVKPLAHQRFDIVTLEQFLESEIGQAEIVVDALLGTGVKGELREEYRQLITALNELQAYRVALDIPTGIVAETGCVAGAGTGTESPAAFRADATISFVALKTGQALNQALEYQGHLILESLGVRAPLSFGQSPQAYYIELSAVKDKLPRRSAAASKFDYGHALIIGGGNNLGGAALLSAKAAIKSGAGMVSCWLEKSNQSAALSQCPEVMWHGLVSSSESPSDVAVLLQAQTERFRTVAIGPGLGRDSFAQQVFEDSIKLLQLTDIPVVLDADALYWLAQNPVILPQRSIITPHAGEAARLMNAKEEDVLSTGRIEPQLSVDTAFVMQNRVKVAETLAKKYQAVCVLKGAGTVVTDGKQTFVTAGAHAAMATAGLGDVLTGLITSLLAQGAEQLDAALLATNLHFEAAKSAAGERTRGVLASEVIDELNLWVNRISG